MPEPTRPPVSFALSNITAAHDGGTGDLPYGNGSGADLTVSWGTNSVAAIVWAGPNFPTPEHVPQSTRTGSGG